MELIGDFHDSDFNRQWESDDDPYGEFDKSEDEAMTIDEAVDVFRNCDERDPWGYDQDDARVVLAEAYLRLTDPTPLTRELIEEELKSIGERVHRDGNEYIFWVNCRMFRFNKYPELDLGDCSIHKPTLGHLRQIVAMLRGGGA